MPQNRSAARHGGKPVAKPQPTVAPAPPLSATPTPEPKSEPAPVEQQDQQPVETLKIDTNLVTVPVIASSIEGSYIPDLRQEEFAISEDGEKQQIAFFATVSAPFHVVLLLDTSASTEEKLGSIRRAAAAFVEQLQSADRVKVISFDNDVRELSDFTNDRAVLRNAIYKTASGKGTKLYDAFELGLSSVRNIRGRKAIVLFSDGVDWHSDAATFDSSLHGLDEEGVVVYPIRYETRAESERIARESSDDPASSLPTIDVIRRAPGGTTAPTFPSDEPSSVPTTEPARTGPFGLPSAAEILRGRRRDPSAEPYPSPDRLPPTGPTGRPDHDPGDVGSGRDTTRPTGRGTRRNGDSISMMLDALYDKADNYLLELANKSGGRVLRADTLGSLPDAFAKIAAELRTQYAIGYYPSNKTRDGQYRKIKVTTTRKNVAVRARPGYRASSGG
ncbi:MAG TPA: VWA domain-containing protein [Pyrinomonadaceae bacterium]|nr:VWA domain-containing protein [Pyrinomonadaceae bacterium]